MPEVSIIGVGQTVVGEHWGISLRALGAEAALNALEDSGMPNVDAIYVGNGYGASISEQGQLGALLADYTGLTGVEAFSVEAGDASGAAALRMGFLAIRSGVVRTVLVVGVEKMTDAVASARVRQRGISLDADYEAVQGATLPSLAGLLMRRYMYEHDVGLEAFEGFSMNAHANGSTNPNAMFRNRLRSGGFMKAPMIAFPVNLFDSAPDADGAAAVVLTSDPTWIERSARSVRIIGSAVSTDQFALQDRPDVLRFGAGMASFTQAMTMAGIDRPDIDLFELHDAFTITSVLSLEAAGFAERGKGWQYACDEGSRISRTGELPVSTFGGLKARGNPGGATGVYQAVEATLQLTESAGDNQVPKAHVAVIQNMGGLASTAVTHVLSR
jgi:acetyl-CoA C-acetyltransferase